MRTADGQGWGQIARASDMRLGNVVSRVASNGCAGTRGQSGENANAAAMRGNSGERGGPNAAAEARGRPANTGNSMRPAMGGGMGGARGNAGGNAGGGGGRGR
jgi:hypothetical protein